MTKHKPPMITSLLDMLIIVIFAQLLAANEDVNASEESLSMAQDSIEALQVEMDDLARVTIDSLSAQLDQITGYDSLSRIQRDQYIANMTEIFELEEDEILQLTENTNSIEHAIANQLMAEFNLSTERDISRLSRQLSEVMRRVDFWEMYVDENSQLTIMIDTTVIMDCMQIRLDRDYTINTICQRIISQQDPPRMVIILFPHHPNAYTDPVELIEEIRLPMQQYLEEIYHNTDIILGESYTI